MNLPQADVGWWVGDVTPTDDPRAVRNAIHDLNQLTIFVRTPAGPALVTGGATVLGNRPNAKNPLPVAAIVPPMPPEQLGDASFRKDHNLKYAYMTGAMANGIASCDLVEVGANAGILSSFGAAGLSRDRIAEAVVRLTTNCAGKPFSFNLIHSPHEAPAEDAAVDLYLKHGVRIVEASAFLDLTLPIVRYRLNGIHVGPNGTPVCPNRVIAKVSRTEVATKFMSPTPEKFLKALRERGDLTDEQVNLAQRVPVAADITAEADSGGHTDNRPLVTLLPSLLALRDRLRQQFGYTEPLRVGAAGGIATPWAAAAAFALGAAYVVTGSINQACVESGSSDRARSMLAEAGPADVMMAPAADMFEMGVKVQVLKRGTMFAPRAAKLFEHYRNSVSWEAIPAVERVRLEKELFRQPFDQVWQLTRSFWQSRDPKQVERAANDPKHQLALVFRWYLGLSSRWANSGEADRQVDYQIWCGPGMGAFNEWVRGSFLAEPKNRKVVAVAKAMLQGTAVATRLGQLRAQGVQPPAEAEIIAPISFDA